MNFSIGKSGFIVDGIFVFFIRQTEALLGTGQLHLASRTEAEQ